MKLITQIKGANILDGEKPVRALEIVKDRMHLIDGMNYPDKLKINEEDVQAFAKINERNLFKSIAVKLITVVYVAKLEHNNGNLWGNINAQHLRKKRKWT